MKPSIIDQYTAVHVAELFRSFSDASRVRILSAIMEQESNTSELAEMVGISESAVSHHLCGLRQMHIVKSRREGKEVYYKAVDATLAFVVEHAAQGSAIVFDYVYQAVLDGTQKQNEIANMRHYRFMTGEGLTFGIPTGSAEPFLRERGYRQAKDISTQELKDIYLIGNNASRKVAGGYGIVIGMVKQKGITS